MLRFESEPACPSKLLIARCYSTIRARIRPNGFERILAHRIGCQRATASLSSRVASKQLCNYSEDGSECQHLETKKFRISTTFIRTPVSSLEGERYPQCTMCREVFPAARASAKVIARLRKFPIASWLGCSPTIRSSSFRRLPIDDSARRIRARLLMNLGAKILRSAIYWANEETKFVTAASYSAGNETPKLSFHVCSFRTALHVLYQFVQTRKFLY